MSTRPKITRGQADALAQHFWTAQEWGLDTISPSWKDLADYLEGMFILTQEEIDRMEKMS